MVRTKGEKKKTKQEAKKSRWMKRAKRKEQHRNSFRANVNKHFVYSVVVVVVAAVCLVASSNKNSRTRHEYQMWQMPVY